MRSVDALGNMPFWRKNWQDFRNRIARQRNVSSGGT